MSETVGVDVARYRERDLLRKVLEERGYRATAVQETARLGFDVECDGDTGKRCDDLLHELEMLVQELDTPFIPQRGEGFVFLRPPSN
ncbi:MAG TPA: hypothetical protein VLB86_11640 [Gaiellaceae bacterium]|nr:hypothetical protein [Gaiellaceae bacterium]